MRVEPLLGRLLAPMLALGLASCISFDWEREHGNRPIDPALVERLHPGETDLAECLALLGAPLWVAEHKTYGVELAYGWPKETGWGVRVSVPVTEQASASFNFDRGGAKTRGIVLLFDPDLKLTIVRRGLLRDISEAGPVRPAYIPPS